MKPAQTFVATILIAVYLFFPGKGLAVAAHFVGESGFRPSECACCAETDDHSDAAPLAGTEGFGDLLEDDCSCWSHVPARTQSLGRNLEFAVILPFEAPHLCPEVYIPIFVPPQNPV